jgi:Inositol hexakisphosphate
MTYLSESVSLILGKSSSQVLFLRKSHGTRLSIFSPVNDLSSLSRSGPQRSLIRGQTNDVAISGGQVLGDEYSDHVVKVCPLPDECVIKPLHPIIESERYHFARGVCAFYLHIWSLLSFTESTSTLLKSDQWHSESQPMSFEMRGAINFRNIPGTNIYALGQPTVEAIGEVVDRVKYSHPEAKHIVWVALREEPIVYVNGAPYCLRRERFSLRNMKGLRRLLGPHTIFDEVSRLWWYFRRTA